LGVLFPLMDVVRAAQWSIAKFAVGWMAPGSTVGTFGVASRISQLGMLPAIAVTRITYPMFFAEGATGLPAALRLAKRVCPAILGIGLISTVGVALIAYVLPHLLGPAYESAKPFLLMLALLPLAAGLQNLAGDVMSGADFQLQRLIAGIAGLALSIATTAAGGLTYGVVGAIAGYMIGQFLLALSNWLMIAGLKFRGARSASHVSS
jgi:O-antigen/teichoic acid export membrane protein